MSKNTIARIIANNRSAFAVHQIWAAFDKLQTGVKQINWFLDRPKIDIEGIKKIVERISK